MKIRDLEIPSVLACGLRLDAIQCDSLASLLVGIETALPKLFGPEQMISANDFWDSRHVPAYLGGEIEGIYPGTIDPTKTLIIGQAEPDSPIALDYRSDPPRVVYFGDCGAWIELAESSRELLIKIGVELPDSPPSTPRS